jgi:hypothetical protein
VICVPSERLLDDRLMVLREYEQRSGTAQCTFDAHRKIVIELLLTSSWRSFAALPQIAIRSRESTRRDDREAQVCEATTVNDVDVARAA